MRVEAGKVDDWWLVVEALGLSDDGDRYAWTTSDIRNLPGWKSASSETRARILVTAHHYLTSDDGPMNEDWFGTNNVYFPATAGYQALTLLQEEAPETFAKIPSGIWEKWSAPIVGFPASTSVDEYDRHQRFVALLYAKAPDRVREPFSSKLIEIPATSALVQWNW